MHERTQQHGGGGGLKQFHGNRGQLTLKRDLSFAEPDDDPPAASLLEENNSVIHHHGECSVVAHIRDE